MRQHRRVHGLIRRRGYPAAIQNACTTLGSPEVCQHVPISELSVPDINLINIEPNTLFNNLHDQDVLFKMESIQQNCCNGIDANMRMEELRGEDSCEEPIIVISSLDEIDNSDQLVTRQLYDDDFCFAGGSNCEDAMPVLEQIITESDPLLKELTSDLERKIVKGGNKNVLYYIEQNRKREAEKKGNKRRLLNSYANLDAIAGLKHLDENSFYTKRGNSNSAKIYDRNTVHCPKCPFRTQSRLRLAPHMAGHERTSGFVCSVCQFKNESSGLLRRHCQMHENDGIVCKWPPDYVGAPSLSKGNNKHGTLQKKQTIKTECDISIEGQNSTINNQKKISHENVIGSSINAVGVNPFMNKKFGCFLNVTKNARISGSFSKSSSVSAKNICKFSCRWCSLLFWSGPAGLLLHKLRHHARMDKQRLTLYKELLLERLDWKPPKPSIENTVSSSIISATPSFDSPINEELVAQITTPRNLPYRCRHCPYSTDQILRLQKHENKHIFKAEHHCQQCSYSCRSMHILMQHSRLHEIESTSSSTTSLSSFAFPNAVSPSHERQPMPSDNFTQDVQQHCSSAISARRGFYRRETNFCPHCPYKSKHNCDMKAHLKMHVERRKFACRHCTYSTMRQNALIAHEKLHQVNITDKGACRRVKWIYAKENGKRSAHLGCQMRILRSGWHFYRCSIVECGAEFAFCSELVRHSRHHHFAWWKKKNGIVGWALSTKNLVRCTICGFRTTLEMRMRDHEAVHQNDECKNVRSVGGVFNCRDCPYSTANYAKFWNHRQKHKRTNRFSCSLCSFSSGSIQCYIEHSKLHGISKIETGETVDKTIKNIKMEAIEMDGNIIETLGDDANKLSPALVSASSTSLHHLSSGDLPTFRKHKFQEQFGAIVPVIAQLKKNVNLINETDSSSSASFKNNARSCMECPYKTSDKVLLKLHLQMHKRGGIRPYSCNLCTFRCFSAESLHSHLSLHSRSFTSNVDKNDDKQQHSLKTSSSRFYQCSQCNFKCVELDSFLLHRKEHVQLLQQRLMTIIKRSANDNGLVKENKPRFSRSARSDKQHFCTKCSFRCDSIQAFSLHMEHHQTNNGCQSGIFSCSICDYNSNTKNVVIFHEKNHHLDVPLTSLCQRIELQKEEKNKQISSS